jgi:hypothetical protein
MATCVEMIPTILFDRRPRDRAALPYLFVGALISASSVFADSPQSAPITARGAPTVASEAPLALPGSPAAPGAPASPRAPITVLNGGSLPADAPIMALSASCLPSGDGYLRAHLAGAIEANVDWPNSGTHCEGEPRDKATGVRLSFRRVNGGKPDLLFVFGITGVREGKPTHEAGVNLTIIVQGTSHIFGTLGDARCTVDSLTQRRLDRPTSYRIEARGFCTQPAHAVRGEGAVLVSTFEFAGPVNYDPPKD